MQRIKRELSKKLKISAGQLNEISLEDVELMDDAQRRVYRAVYEMAECGLEGSTEPARLQSENLMPCTSYWVEGSRDLVLYIWNEYLTKTIVVPEEQWAIRKDITVN